VRILHQDTHVLAIDKPAGLLTVPGRGTDAPALSVQVREVAPEAIPVHRLDRDTSGVVLFAVSRAAHRALNAAFESRRAEKTYLALARGDLAEERRVDLPLATARGGRVRIAEEDEEGARKAQTRVQPKERFGRYTFCACVPRTGRTHQIRVHLAALGHPLAIDPRYGDDEPLRVGDLWSGSPDPDEVVLSRTPLHAAALRIPHPRGHGWLWVESPLPDDIARCLDLLRAARRYSVP
jgi:RluA family pseudouridine synthase